MFVGTADVLYFVSRRLNWVRQVPDVVFLLVEFLKLQYLTRQKSNFGEKIGHIYITKKLTERDTSNKDSLMALFMQMGLYNCNNSLFIHKY